MNNAILFESRKSAVACNPPLFTRNIHEKPREHLTTTLQVQGLKHTTQTMSVSSEKLPVTVYVVIENVSATYVKSSRKEAPVSNLCEPKSRATHSFGIAH